jgi:ubiquinone/menaquinone biosynthesis C-methylase UbiE
MNWVMGNIKIANPQSRALDMATGTGIFARSLADVCRSVTGLDATDAMLQEVLFFT